MFLRRFNRTKDEKTMKPEDVFCWQKMEKLFTENTVYCKWGLLVSNVSILENIFRPGKIQK